MNHPTHTVMAVIDKVTKDGKGIAKAEAMRAATAVHDVRSNDLTMRTDLRSVSWAPTVVLTGEQPPF